jgi:hypothetical protein
MRKRGVPDVSRVPASPGGRSRAISAARYTLVAVPDSFLTTPLDACGRIGHPDRPERAIE